MTLHMNPFSPPDPGMVTAGGTVGRTEPLVRSAPRVPRPRPPARSVDQLLTDRLGPPSGPGEIRRDIVRSAARGWLMPWLAARALITNAALHLDDTREQAVLASVDAARAPGQCGERLREHLAELQRNRRFLMGHAALSLTAWLLTATSSLVCLFAASFIVGPPLSIVLATLTIGFTPPDLLLLGMLAMQLAFTTGGLAMALPPWMVITAMAPLGWLYTRTGRGPGSVWLWAGRGRRR